MRAGDVAGLLKTYVRHILALFVPVPATKAPTGEKNGPALSEKAGRVNCVLCAGERTRTFTPLRH